MQLNWVDLVIVDLLLFFALEALGSSLLSEVLDFFSFLLAFFISFAYYQVPAGFLETQFNIPHNFSLVLGFMALWFFSEIGFFIIVRLIIPYFPKIFKTRFYGENLLAILPALLRGLIFIALFLVITATFPIQPWIKRDVQNSHFGSLILKHAYRLEQPVKQVFGGATQDSLTFLTIKPKSDESINLGFTTREVKGDPKKEMEMIDLVNKERSSRGLKKLSFDGSLREIARKHSRDMFARGYFSHYSPEGKSIADRADESRVTYSVIGENLAYAPSLDLAHTGLINSPGHRANILSPDFAKVGIGIMDGGVYGLMITQVFSN